MAERESEYHSFVLRLWVEEPATRKAPALWRGHITNLLDRQRRYVQTCQEIQDFISGYVLEE
jgi:hypothetical protein